MVRFSHVVSGRNGLHAQNAMELARAAEGYPCRIYAECNGRRADAKQVLALLGLAARHKDTVTFQIEGPDEAAAGSSLLALAEAIL